MTPVRVFGLIDGVGRDILISVGTDGQYKVSKTSSASLESGLIQLPENIGGYGARTRQAVGNRQNLAQGLSSGGNQMVASKIRHRTGVKAVSNIKMRFVNWYVSGANIEVGNSVDITVTASIEYPAGVFHQVKVAGATSFTVSRLIDYLETDAVGITIPAYTNWWIHTWADAGAGNNYPYATAQGRTALDGYESGASVTDKTMVGGELQTGGTGTYGPSIVTGEVLGYASTTVILGDSRAVGNNDRTAATGDAFGNSGHLERLLAPAGFNIINFGIPSTQASQIVTMGSFKRRLALLSAIPVSSIINQFGINDITNGRTATQLLADQATINAAFAPICGRIIMDTLLPKSTSSDSWITTTNQGIADATKEGYRVTYNTAVRAGQVIGMTDFLDSAAAAETSLNSGIFKVTGGAWTDDGTHLIPVGAAAIAAALTTNVFQ